MLLFVIALLVALYILAFQYSYLRKFFLVLRIPGPTAYPLIGNGLLFANKSSVGGFKLLHLFGAFFIRPFKNRKFEITPFAGAGARQLLPRLAGHRREHYRLRS